MERKILQILDAGGPLHVVEIASQIDEHPVIVDQVCARLHDESYIRSIGGGRYRLTDDGSERLTDDCTQGRVDDEIA